MHKVSVSNDTWEAHQHLVDGLHKLTLGSGSRIINSIISGSLSVDKMSCVNRSGFSGFNGLGCFSYVADSQIGRYSTIASRVSCGAFNHPTDWLSVSEFQYRDVSSCYEKNNWFLSEELLSRNKTVIGHDVWICDNSVIIAGCKVGTGAIIGANSVVTKDIPDYAIVAGNPASLIRYRFPQEIIETLLSLKWWKLGPEELSRLKLNYADIDSCIDQLSRFTHT